MKMKIKNKKIQIVFVAIIVLLIGALICFWAGKEKYSQKNVVDTEKVAESKAAAVAESDSTAQSSINAQEKIQPSDDYVGDFKVARVIDGDTIEIEGGEKVRYIGMDAPETVDPVKPVECFGKEASAENRKLVEGKTVHLEKDTSDRDKYGRLLRYVWVGSDFVNLELVGLGFARVETIAPDVKYEGQFLDAQNLARSSNLGLWSACSNAL